MTTTPREERRLVSILFVDLVGFTERADDADPEDVRDLLRVYHAEAKSRIEQHGGVLEKFIGDAVMAVFGAPVAHGDDAERAVRAGLRVLEDIDELNRDRGLGLAARAAVNTGEAVVSLDADRTDALAIGDVVNTTSRLQSAAPAGRLIVGAATHSATRDVVQYEPFGRVAAKGKAESPEAWLAVAAGAETGERRAVGRRSSASRTRSTCSTPSGPAAWPRSVRTSSPSSGHRGSASRVSAASSPRGWTPTAGACSGVAACRTRNGSGTARSAASCPRLPASSAPTRPPSRAGSSATPSSG